MIGPSGGRGAANIPWEPIMQRSGKGSKPTGLQKNLVREGRTGRQKPMVC